MPVHMNVKQRNPDFYTYFVFFKEDHELMIYVFKSLGVFFYPCQDIHAKLHHSTQILQTEWETG